jgi:hypothetical protein
LCGAGSGGYGVVFASPVWGEFEGFDEADTAIGKR